MQPTTSNSKTKKGATVPVINYVVKDAWKSVGIAPRNLKLGTRCNWEVGFWIRPIYKQACGRSARDVKKNSCPYISRLAFIFPTSFNKNIHTCLCVSTDLSLTFSQVLQLPWFNRPKYIKITKDYKLWRSPPPPPSLLNVLPPRSKSPNLCSSLDVRDQGSHSYNKTNIYTLRSSSFQIQHTKIKTPKWTAARTCKI
jgi:hypothetical protein